MVLPSLDTRSAASSDTSFPFFVPDKEQSTDRTVDEGGHGTASASGGQQQLASRGPRGTPEQLQPFAAFASHSSSLSLQYSRPETPAAICEMRAAVQRLADADRLRRHAAEAVRWESRQLQSGAMELLTAQQQRQRRLALPVVSAAVAADGGYPSPWRRYDDDDDEETNHHAQESHAHIVVGAVTSRMTTGGAWPRAAASSSRRHSQPQVSTATAAAAAAGPLGLLPEEQERERERRRRRASVPVVTKNPAQQRTQQQPTQLEQPQGQTDTGHDSTRRQQRTPRGPAFAAMLSRCQRTPTWHAQLRSSVHRVQPAPSAAAAAATSEPPPPALPPPPPPPPLRPCVPTRRRPRTTCAAAATEHRAGHICGAGARGAVAVMKYAAAGGGRSEECCWWSTTAGGGAWQQQQEEAAALRCCHRPSTTRHGKRGAPHTSARRCGQPLSSWEDYFDAFATTTTTTAAHAAEDCCAIGVSGGHEAEPEDQDLWPSATPHGLRRQRRRRRHLDGRHRAIERAETTTKALRYRRAFC
jgi:hypothetical protein